MWLSDLSEQDSYSYALAYVYMGAPDEETLLSNYERVLERLPFEFEKIDDTFDRPTEESHPPA